jgi:hypothetical protein
LLVVGVEDVVLTSQDLPLEVVVDKEVGVEELRKVVVQLLELLIVVVAVVDHQEEQVVQTQLVDLVL